MFLTHEHITQALLTSDDDGETINLANWGFTEVSEATGEELANLGKTKTEQIGIVARIALNSNALNDLPRSLELITRLRYLNLRANAFTVFPAVLTSLPKLEILDISRNNITELPPRAGTLTNLNVFSFARNLVTRLPVYFTDFEWLRVLKLEGNPITFPPPEVWNHKSDNDEEAQHWLNELKGWLLVHADSEGQESEDAIKHSSDDEVLVARTQLARSNSAASDYAFQHERSYSTDSDISLTSFDSRPSESLEPAFVPVIAPSSSFTTLPIQSTSSPSHSFEAQAAESAPQATHNRGMSYSVESSTKAARRRTQMLGKKSMPNLRTTSRNELSIPAQPMLDQYSPSTAKRSPMPTPSLPPSAANVPPPRASANRQPSSAKIDDSSVPIDDERNHYFRRISALPKPRAEAPAKIPPSLLQTVDAIRGILFSLSQIYTSVRNYTASAIDERTSSVLIKVLDPASSYMSGLISALERFDAAAETGGVPPPEICRTLLSSCRDNVAVFGKVTGVLQLQLKMLASSHDPRYTRTLLLMLYGSMAEISNSWAAMQPHLPALVPFLRPQTQGKRRRHQPSLSGDIPRGTRVEGGVAGRYNGNGALNGHPTVEKTPSPPATAGAVGPAGMTPNSNRRTLVARARRQAGSFSSNDVEVGRTLPSRSPSESSYPPGAGVGTSPSLSSPMLTQRPPNMRSNSSVHSSQQYSPLQPPSAPFASSSRSHSRGQSNSSSGSMPSPSLSNSALSLPAPATATTPSALLNLPPGPTPSSSNGTIPPSPQHTATRSRSRNGDHPHSRYPSQQSHYPPLPTSVSSSSLSAGTNVQSSVTTSRLVDADLFDSLELAADHAQAAWSMLEDILRSTSTTDAQQTDSHTPANGQSVARNREQLWEALDRVQGVTNRIIACFSSARDGDSDAAKALGEDAHLFVKATVQILVLLKTFATTHALPPRLRDRLTKLTSAMSEATTFLHVSSYAPTPTPAPQSSSGLSHAHNASASSSTMGTPSNATPRPYSPATYAFVPATPLSNIGNGSGSGSGGGGVGLGLGSAGMGPSSNGGLHPTHNGAIVDDRFTNGLNGNGNGNGASHGGHGGHGGSGAGFLSRSKSAAAAPTPLKLGIGAGTMAGGGGTSRDMRDPPHTALPQNQSFRFGQEGGMSDASRPR